MKYFLFFLFITCNNAWAQDTIQQLNGKHLTGYIIDSDAYSIRYTLHPGNASSRNPSRRISKSAVTAVTYRTGTQNIFNLHKRIMPGDTTSGSLNTFQLYELGRSDASIYYKRYKGASNGTLVATIPGSPALGLIVALSTSLSQPKDKNLTFPNPVLSINPDYRAGYVQKAKKIKAGKVWTSWLVGCLATTVIYVAFGIAN